MALSRAHTPRPFRSTIRPSVPPFGFGPATLLAEDSGYVPSRLSVRFITRRVAGHQPAVSFPRMVPLAAAQGCLCWHPILLEKGFGHPCLHRPHRLAFRAAGFCPRGHPMCSLVRLHSRTRPRAQEPPLHPSLFRSPCGAYFGPVHGRNKLHTGSSPY